MLIFLRALNEKIIFHSWTVPIALLIISILGFGFMISGLGFYQDDWRLVWFSRSFGPSVFTDFFTNERPFYAGIHMLTMPIVGDSPLAWHIFILISRWFSSVVVWWTLRILWPNHTRQVTWIAILYLVYPGFKQQSLAVAHSQNFIILSSEIFSLGAMLWAIRKPRWGLPLTILALLGSTFSVFSIEYFFGLEFLRPLLLWLILRENTPRIRDRIRRTFLRWVPYLIVAIVFLIWRLFVFQFPTYGLKLVENLLTNPRSTIIHLIQTIIQDTFEVSLFAWGQTLEFVNTFHPGIRSALFNWVIIFSSIIVVTYYLSKVKYVSKMSSNHSSDDEKISEWSKQSITVGVFSLLVVGWPFWFVGLPIELEIPNDRFTFAFMLGVSIFLVGLLELLIKTHTQKIVIIGAMVGLAIGQHVKIANTFREVHNYQEAFFRQLVWRAPGLKPNTLILINTFPFPYSGASSLSAPLNWIYTSDYSYPHMYYNMYYIPEKLGTSIPELTKGLPVEFNYRSLKFVGSTSQALIAYYDPPGCLQIFEPGVHDSIPRLPPLVSRAIPLSNTGQIIPNADKPSQIVNEIFGSEPPVDWCYFFETADLARQLSNWEKIVELGDLAFQQSLEIEHKNEMEFLPFIEGYANVGNWDKAYLLTQKTVDPIPAMSTTLCQTWERIKQNTPPSSERQTVLSNLSEVLGCSLQ